MKVNQAFPRKYADAADLGGKSVTLEIDHLATEQVYRPQERDQQTIYIVYFKGAKKGVVMSSRLAHEIAEAIGDDEMNNWIGKKVT